MAWGRCFLAMSLVGPRDLCWSLAHIQQRPGGGQLYWLHFPPRPHQVPGNWQGCLHPLVGQRGSVCGAGAQPREAGGSKAGHLGSQGLGTVGVWAWRDIAWVICGASSAPSGCCLCGQLTSRGCPKGVPSRGSRRPRALLLQLRKGMGVAGGTMGGAGAQSPEALSVRPLRLPWPGQ